jgi:peptide/nickel transport system permease protein
MLSYLFRRIFTAVITLLVACLAVGTLMHLVPGDPVQMMMAQMSFVSIEQMDEMRHRLGLDLPAWQQSVNYVWMVLHGDFGITIFGRESVLELLLGRLPNTLLLTLSSLLVALLIGLPSGIIAAYKRGSALDNFLMFIAVLGVSVPAFWLGMILLIIFSLNFEFVPVAGGGVFSVILPSLTLGLVYSAVIARMTRSAMIEILTEDFIRTARAKGLTEKLVLFRHALKPSMIAVITTIGMIFGYLMGGQVIVENVFSWNGIGRLAVYAMLQRDYPMIQGFIVLFTTIIVSVSLLLDLIYAWLDPRIRYG